MGRDEFFALMPSSAKRAGQPVAVRVDGPETRRGWARRERQTVRGRSGALSAVYVS